MHTILVEIKTDDPELIWGDLSPSSVADVLLTLASNNPEFYSATVTDDQGEIVRESE